MRLSASLRSLWQRALVRYVVVGMGNTAFSYALYLLALWLGCGYPVASFVSLVAGICLSFKTQGALVFLDRRNSRFGRFIIAWAVVYASNVAMIALFVHIGFSAAVGGAMALPFNVLLGFLLQRHFVFARGQGACARDGQHE